MGIPLVGLLLRAGARAAMSKGFKKTAKNILKVNVKGGRAIKSAPAKIKQAGPVLKQAGQDIKHVAKVGGGQTLRSIKATKTFKQAGPMVTKSLKSAGQTIANNPIKSTAGLAAGSYYVGKKRGQSKTNRRKKYGIK